MKKFISLLTIFIVFISISPLSVAANSDIHIFVNGVEQHYDVMPYLQDGTTYLPVRHIAETIGSTVEWDNDTQTVEIMKNSDHIVFQVGKTTAFVNGIKKKIPVSFLKNNRTMVPVRFISEQFGLEVEWDNDKRHVLITEPILVEEEEEVEETVVKDEQQAEVVKSATPIAVQLTAAEQSQADELLKDTDRLDKIDSIIELGSTLLGKPYQYGAAVGDTSQFDCSSLLAYLYQQHDVNVPRIASDQAKVGMQIPKDQLSRGDLLFFDTALNGQIEHVGIYLGNNEMLHVSTSRGVQITPLFDYWHDRYVVGTRF